MEVAMPLVNNGIVATMDSYEDMFKEITRKLYGEDGLPDIIASEKLTSIPSALDKGLTGIDYEVDSSMFKSDEHITAFGLAALMQNGFSSGGMLNTSFPQASKQGSTPEDKWITNEDNLQWTHSKIASYNPFQKLFKCIDCECVGFLMRVAEHWLGTHANLRVFQCPQCPYASAWARCVRMHVVRQHNINIEETLDTFLKDNPVMHEIIRYLQTLKNKYENISKSGGSQSTVLENASQSNKTQNNSPQRINISTSPSIQNINDNSSMGNSSIASKRYSCSYCPYATDRRDLFTRHENIHREEKPFQCYVCQKQFNRADHVKKHFLRMHREHPYDLNRIRRQPPKNASGMSYYHKYNNTETSVPSSSEPTSTSHQVIHQLTIPNGLSVMNRSGQQLPVVKSANNQSSKPAAMKLNSSKSNCKKKGDKRYSCCYCSWSGVDNWCLKRHLNTHLKPFVCGLCDYKAARSERLATHVLKVHNKRACGRCLYLADDQAQLTIHQQEHHSIEQRNNKSSSNILRSTTYSGIQNPMTQTFSQNIGPVTPVIKTYDISAAILQHGSRLLPMGGNFSSNTSSKPWKSYTPKQHGAARLFNYMEASDGSDAECDSNLPSEDSNRISNISNRTNSDFLEAGDVGIQNNGEQEEFDEDMELPLFMCRECGCEFIDDISLETHTFTHHQVEKIPTSPRIKKSNENNVTNKKNSPKESSSTTNKPSIETKENLNPKSNYICMVCKLNFTNQIHIMNHMKSHVNLVNKKWDVTGKKSFSNKKNDFCDEPSIMNCYQNNNGTFKRSRKQSQPRKVVSPFFESQEIQVMKGTSLKNRQWQCNNENSGNLILKLREKYMNKLITRKGYYCNLCKKGQSLFPYHTKSSLAIHMMFKHVDVHKFECEHCSLKFKHRYQVVLHSSRKHINYVINPFFVNKTNNTHHQNMIPDLDKQIVPKVKETILCNNVAVPAHNLQNNNTIMTTNVPDNTTSDICVEKMNIHSFLEQSIIHPNNSVNNSMPITIPTFPPS